MSLLSKLKKIRVQHVDRNIDGVEIKTDVDVMTDADCITMDDGDLRSGVKKMIDDRIGQVIDGAPEQLDTLKEIATELEKNQSGVSTIIKAMNDKLEAKDLEGYAKTIDVDDKLKDKVGVVNGKGLSTNDYTNNDKAKVHALDPLSSDKKLVYKQKRNTDFNNITEAGFYTVQTSTNAPHNQYDYWSLLVLNSTSVDSGTYVQQIAINEKIDDRAIYVRKKSSGWSTWTKLEAAPDLSNYAKSTDIKTKLSDMIDDSMHRTVTDEEKKKWNDKAIELDKSGMGEARIKKLIKCMADPDYLFSNNKDLYKDLNDIYGTNFNSSTTDIYKLLKSGEEIDKLVNNADLCVSFAKSKYLIKLVYSDSFRYKILDKLSHNFDMFKAFFNNKSVINELSKEGRDLMLRAKESLPLDDSRYAETILDNRELFFSMSEDSWSQLIRYLIQTFTDSILYSEDKYKLMFNELLIKRPRLFKQFLCLNNDDFKSYAGSFIHSSGFMYNAYCLRIAFTSTEFIELVTSYKMYSNLFLDSVINNNAQCFKETLYDTIKSSNLFNKTVVIEDNLSALNEKCKTDNSIIFITVLNNNAKVKVKHKNKVTAFIDSDFRDFDKNNKQEIVELSGVSYTGCTFESNGHVRVLCEIYTAK